MVLRRRVRPVSILERLERLVTRPAVSLTLVFAVALASALEIQRTFEPFPSTLYDFSHLLAADTFVRGRLANPPHPSWVHFESPFVLQQPFYVSALPPMQGVLLALGRGLGHPLYGVAVGFGLAAAAVSWMVRGWLSTGWALLAGMVIALHPRIGGIWGAGFSGGIPALFGAALLYGALPRLLRGEVRSGPFLALGAGVLALSQPLHGLVAAVPALGYLAFGLLRRKAGRALPTRALGAAAVGLCAVAACFGYYNFRTTGSALTTPYALYEETYAPAPQMIILPHRGDVEHRHASLRVMYGEESAGMRNYQARRTWEGFWPGVAARFSLYWKFYLLLPLSALLLILPFALREPGTRFALVASLVFLAAIPLDTYDIPWNTAAYLPAFCLLFAGALRRWWHVGYRALPIGPLVVMVLLPLGWYQQYAKVFDVLDRRALKDLEARRFLERSMQRQADANLVLVDYGNGHNVRNEWVYNEAGIEDAQIVWARSISPEADKEIVNAFPEHKVWALDSRRRGMSVKVHPDAGIWRGEPPPAPRVQRAPHQYPPEELRALRKQVQRWQWDVRNRLGRPF
jgi:hypothetical protein